MNPPRRANATDAPYIERYAPVIVAQGRTRARLPTRAGVSTYPIVHGRTGCEEARRYSIKRRRDVTRRDGVNTTQKPSGVNSGF
ncbi:hypothetical protein ACS0PU_005173 [Formica fusca]